VASANVAFVQSIIKAWERGDYSHAAQWADPNIQFVLADGPTPSNANGLAALGEGLKRFRSAWEEFDTGADEFRDIGNNRVLVLIHWSGRLKDTTEPEQLRGHGARVFNVRDGKVTQLVNYLDRERALADLEIAL
jgi:ketosteroid isomerase-like protein